MFRPFRQDGNPIPALTALSDALCRAPRSSAADIFRRRNEAGNCPANQRCDGNSIAGWCLRIACLFCFLPFLTDAGPGHAQSADRLAQVSKIFVDSLGTDHGAAEIREQMIRRLRKSQDVQVVSSAIEADALIRGTGRIWVTGHISLNPHTHSPSQPTFGGFLSAEVVGRNGQTLWSYLVSPSDFVWNGITDDLARQLVNKLLAELKAESKLGPAAPAPVQQLAGTLKGAGATFPAPLYQQWFQYYQEQDPNAHIAYDAVGSEEGIKRLKERSVDFGASEMPLSDQAMTEAGQRFRHVPSALGAVVVIYNVNGLRENLNFTPETLSGIYLGRIRKWNDPEIRKSNRGADLPDTDIAVVHRSDGSGTSFVFTDYLSRVSAQWKTSVGAGTTVQWPVGIGAKANEGVASIVQQTPNSIGYVEFIYALQHELRYGTVRNASGNFIAASISSVTAAAARNNAPSQDFRVSITNPAGKDAYPISTYTWLLVPERMNDKNKQKVLMDLLGWALTSGQKKCAELGYAPLPPEIAKAALDSLSR
jgi:phosphate ABC transporter phosphate-binding protein